MKLNAAGGLFTKPIKARFPHCHSLRGNVKIFFMNHEYLLNVSKPSRYTGGEINAVIKDLSRVRLKFALAFPDVYEVGMSHVGLQILYHLLNRPPTSPASASSRPGRTWRKDAKRGVPLSSLESALPLREFRRHRVLPAIRAQLHRGPEHPRSGRDSFARLRSGKKPSPWSSAAAPAP